LPFWVKSQCILKGFCIYSLLLKVRTRGKKKVLKKKDYHLINQDRSNWKIGQKSAKIMAKGHLAMANC